MADEQAPPPPPPDSDERAPPPPPDDNDTTQLVSGDILSGFADSAQAVGLQGAMQVASLTEDDRGELENDLTKDEMAMLETIQAAIQMELCTCDPEFRLDPDNVREINCDVLDQVFSVMKDENRTELDTADLAHIRKTVRKMVRDALALPTLLRFKQLDRVVCNIGGDRGWAAGAVQALNEDDPSDPTGQRSLPYVVKIDPPNSRLVSVPKDENEVVRAEVCFGQRAGSIWFTRMCLPKALRRGAQRVRRFGLHDRVACAVEDATDEYTDWAAGTVVEVDHVVEESEGVQGGVVPYKVMLDSGCEVLAHVDEHWLIRDLELQAPGPRIAKDGTRAISKMSKRKASDGWEMVDHMTRKVRKVQEESDSDE